MARSIAVICIVAVSLQVAPGGEAFEDCEEAVKVTKVESDGHVSLIVQNHAAYDATVTLKVRANNGAVSRLKPETDTYAARSVTEAVRLSAAEPDRRWRMHYRFHWVKGSMHAEHDDSVLYRLPYEPGTSHRVTQGYNGKTHHGPDQYAVDFSMREGTAVCAARDGVVVDLEESFQVGGPDKKYGDQSNFVSIAHADGTIAEYHHLQYDGVLVEIGRQVKAGEQIALSGNTGYSSRAHLHFGVHSPVDGTRLQSHRVTFTTVQGAVTEPLPGYIYTAK
jgi:murein DD-endopeptidase MepM/ murein hydrolase activator NlpD